MTTPDVHGVRSPGVFLAVPTAVPQTSVAYALRMLGFDPGTVRGLTLNVDAQGMGEVVAAVEYVDRRDAVARRALAQVTVPIARDTPEPPRTAPSGP